MINIPTEIIKIGKLQQKIDNDASKVFHPETEIAQIVDFPETYNNEGKYLSTDGSKLTWSSVDALPSQSGNSGKVLTTNGSSASWQDVDGLPDQANNSGKFLTTNGTTASWTEISSNIPPLERGILVSDGESLEWNIFSNQRYDYVPNAETSTVSIPLATLNNSVAVEVYRNGMLLTDQEDYSINTTTGVLTLVSALGTTERISVISKVSAFESDYILPIATSSTLGGVKIGSNLTIDPVTGVLSADAQSMSITNTGTGNAVTSVTESNGVITVDKGSTFSLSTHNHDTEYAPIDIIPAQTNNSGKYLTTNGSALSWATVDALPSQTNNSGKFLTTNGTDASWADLTDIVKISSLHYPSSNDTTITLTSAQSIPNNVNKYTMSVYRNGIYLNNTIDYGFNSSTRVLTFNKAFGVDEIVTVVFNYFSTDSQTTFDLDIDQFEAGTNITFTDNPVTNKIIISSTDSFSNWDKDYDDLINKPTIPVIPANISAFTNDSGYITGVTWDDVTNKPSTFTPATHSHDTEYAPIDIIPSQTNNSGKYLTTDGTDLSWATVDALPSQTNNSGKFLTTNGATASWANVELLPDQTNNEGKFLYTDGTDTSWEDIFVHEVRLDSVHYPTENTNSITLTTAQAPSSEVDKWGLSVYRNGIYLTKTVDYTYIPETRTITFVDNFGSNDIVTVNFAYLTSEGTDASWNELFSRYTTINITTDGIHTVTLPSSFITDDYNSVMVFLDGIKQVLNTDYTINTNTGVITFVEELLDGDTVVVGLYTASTTHYDAINDLFSTIGSGVLVGNGNTLEYKDFTKRLYTQDTTSANETIIVPTENLVNAIVTEVYRNGLLMIPSDDYTVNTNTGVITFTEGIKANEKIAVLTQNAIVSNIEYTNTAITQDISDNSTNVATTAYVTNKINALPTYATPTEVTTAINNRFANPIEKVNVIASNSSISIDPNSGSLFMLSLSTNASITINAIQNGPYTTNGATITMYLNNTSNTITWDSTKITWMSGSAPDVTTNPSIITFVTFNSGSTWYGSAIEISS